MLQKVKELIPSPEKDVDGFPCTSFPFRNSDNSWKRITRSMLQIPFGLAAGTGLAAVLSLIFSVEVFINEVYSGPFKQFLVFPHF
jgi:hypothetical protein